VSNLYHNRKEIIIDVLNSIKIWGLCGNKDLDVINAKVWVLLCKIIEV
jgi:hypothetical protein